jgi:hypothetical protein
VRRRYNPYTLPPWLKKTRSVCQQFALPFCIFQAVRTILFPTAFDVLFLIALVLLTVAFKLELI